ncbi:hypothetical protein B0H34DRAFT_488149 [Crassisporium funariophilum]|nr:hypothetical protein B0H34DRAFT_488149 [Crassisporium funariophilum]
MHCSWYLAKLPSNTSSIEAENARDEEYSRRGESFLTDNSPPCFGPQYTISSESCNDPISPSQLPQRAGVIQDEVLAMTKLVERASNIHGGSNDKPGGLAPFRDMIYLL